VNGYYFHQLKEILPIIGTQDVPWDESVIGKFIAITDPKECYLPGDMAGRGQIVAHPLYRWYRITGLQKRADGHLSLGVESVWWGNHRNGGVMFFRYDSRTRAFRTSSGIRPKGRCASMHAPITATSCWKARTCV
jgi:hypothetical protein